MKPPFKLSPLRACQHPIAYLLILCDEIQDWNRNAYGEFDIPSIEKDVNLFINNHELILSCKNKPAQYRNNKIRTRTLIVKGRDIFSKGIKIRGGAYG